MSPARPVAAALALGSVFTFCRGAPADCRSDQALWGQSGAMKLDAVDFICVNQTVKLNVTVWKPDITQAVEVTLEPAALFGNNILTVPAFQMSAEITTLPITSPQEITFTAAAEGFHPVRCPDGSDWIDNEDTDKDGDADGDGLTSDKEKAWVIGVTAIAFEEKDSPLDNNLHPTAPGGLRLFPGKQDPADVLAREEVYVVATIAPALAPEEAGAGVLEADRKLIYFRAFDVDDPSADGPPIDPTDDAGDDSGLDNRGGGSLAELLVKVNHAGEGLDKARTTLRASFQPGDNFRIAAACAENRLDRLSADRAKVLDTNNSVDLYVPFGSGAPDPLGAGGVEPFEGKVTDTLTTWRRLHVEVDSMGEEPVGTNFDPDDLLRGDVRDPDISAFAGAFDDAYVVPVQDTGNDDPQTPWTYHFNYNQNGEVNAYLMNERGTPEGADYWAVYVLGAYEGFTPDGQGTFGDNDPLDSELAERAGETLLNEPNGPEGSFVYEEVIRDLVFDQFGPLGWGNDEFDHIWKAMTLHEVGHQFDLDHDLAAPPPGSGLDWVPPSIMWAPENDSQEIYARNIPLTFNEEDIALIRNATNGP